MSQKYLAVKGNTKTCNKNLSIRKSTFQSLYDLFVKSPHKRLAKWIVDFFLKKVGFYKIFTSDKKLFEFFKEMVTDKKIYYFSKN